MPGSLLLDGDPHDGVRYHVTIGGVVTNLEVAGIACLKPKDAE
jgi:hypothetical protein